MLDHSRIASGSITSGSTRTSSALPFKGSWHSASWPVQLRVGATGFGVGVGCGVGIGFGRPLQLAAVPGLGQIAGAISSGLGQLNSATGGLGKKVGSVVSKTLQQKAGRLTHLWDSLAQRPRAMQDSAESGTPQSMQLARRETPSRLQADAATTSAGHEDAEGILAKPASWNAGTAAPQSEAGMPIVPEIMCTLLRQQEQIHQLQSENVEMRAAICAVNRKAPFC
ncbi:hypothetical protein WJX72_006163 [[Myrmecia] bisecta]|uniref:Uncharacterized protein n=1 Tax=[Myrmecia] bisecta TaxID=41462 RepID=A0AAW1Q996_9CHLO